MTKFQKKKCLEAAEQKTSKLLVVVCCCKTVESAYQIFQFQSKVVCKSNGMYIAIR